MAYNDKNMVNDYNGHKIPQYYNPVTDKYEPLHGADGVSFVGNHVLSPGGVWIPQTGNDDGSINTRVTGSNLVHEETDIFIPSGSNIAFFYDSVGDYVEVAIMNQGATFNNILVQVRDRNSKNRIMTVKNVLEVTAPTNRADSLKSDIAVKKLISSGFEVILRNNSSADVNLNALNVKQFF